MNLIKAIVKLLGGAYFISGGICIILWCYKHLSPIWNILGNVPLSFHLIGIVGMLLIGIIAIPFGIWSILTCRR